MIIFRPEHVQPILDGRKTETRRLANRRWQVGSVHEARLHLFKTGTTFARLRILDVRGTDLGNVSAADAKAEGYETREAFLEAFARINRLPLDFALTQRVWVIKFKVEAPK